MDIQIKTNASGEIYLQDDRGRITRLYRFREALSLAGITTTTYYLWVKRGLIADARMRDKGQWRVFTEMELKALLQAGAAHSRGVEWRPPPNTTAHERAYTWREGS